MKKAAAIFALLSLAWLPVVAYVCCYFAFSSTMYHYRLKCRSLDFNSEVMVWIFTPAEVGEEFLTDTVVEIYGPKRHQEAEEGLRRMRVRQQIREQERASSGE